MAHCKNKTMNIVIILSHHPIRLHQAYRMRYDKDIPCLHTDIKANKCGVYIIVNDLVALCSPEINRPPLYWLQFA